MKTYQGSDVKTEGKDRFVRVAVNGREVWARAVKNHGASKRLVGDYAVRVLGWGVQGVLFEDFSPADREKLLTTLD